MKYLKLFALVILSSTLTFCSHKTATENAPVIAQNDSIGNAMRLDSIKFAERHTDTLVPLQIYPPVNANESCEISFGGINTSLFSDTSNLAQIQKAIQQQYALIVTYNGLDSIITIQSPPRTGKGMQMRFQLPVRGVAKPAPEKAKALKHYISADSARILFNNFKTLICNSARCDTFNPCLTFNFKTNGCFARAHWMRKIIENDNGYYSNKIFSFGRLRAANNGACDKRCVNWGWHVAPVVFTNNGGVIDTLVIDPSIADGPKSVSDWLDLQKVKCKRGGFVTSYEIVTSDHYSYDKGNYIYDTPYYHYTKAFLAYYCNYCAAISK